MHNFTQEEFKAFLKRAEMTESDLIKYRNDMLQHLHGNKTNTEKFDEYLKGNPAFKMSLVSDSGHVKVVQIPTFQKQDIVIIDWINLTVKDDTFNTEFVISDADLIRLASDTIESIFGFGITTVRPNGALFYQRSYEIGDNYGMVCHGGQNGTFLLSVNATGLMNATSGWELRLFNFLEVAVSPSITRIDLAHDIFNAPRFLLDHYLALYDKDAFTNYRNKPKISQVGNWHTLDDLGRTLYIGSRKGGLFTRIYEKGKQLQSLDFPNWLRLESEIKSQNRYITHDILLSPHEYFAGLYPAFRSFNTKFQRIDTFKKEVKSDVEKRIKFGKHQTGGLIKLLKELAYTDEQIVEMLAKDKIPKQFQRMFIGNSKQSIHSEPAAVVANFNLLDD